jgi:antitoxin HigA-1
MLKSWTTTRRNYGPHTNPPGEILAYELKERDISPTELSRQLNVPPNRVTQIINGQRNITGDTTLRLGHWFQTNAQFWLNAQALYAIDLANVQIGAEVKSCRYAL